MPNRHLTSSLRTEAVFQIPHSAFRNPHSERGVTTYGDSFSNSAIRNPHSERGVTTNRDSYVARMEGRGFSNSAFRISHSVGAWGT